jgi:cytochrome c5
MQAFRQFAVVERATSAQENSTVKVIVKGKYVLACGSAAALVIAAAGLLVVSRTAVATAQFGTQTGKSCGDCHTAAKGGGPLTPFGEKFKANGNKLPK